MSMPHPAGTARTGALRLARALLVAACTLGAAHARAADLVVSAASSLTQAFRALAPAFEAAHPGTRLLFNFAASDTLVAQLARGAPVDVLATADQASMDRAAQQQLLAAGSRRDFAGNALVLVVPAEAALPITGLRDLLRQDVRRITLGHPASVPAGRYAREALEAAGLWPAIEPKAVFAQNVRQGLDYVARGEVDAGFVYATDAAAQKGKVRSVASLPTVTPIRYPIAVIAGGPNPQGAARFVAWVASPAGQAVLALHGFSAP